MLSQNLNDQAGKQDASKGADTSAYRGIYVGDMFYIVSTETITSYDRTPVSYTHLDVYKRQVREDRDGRTTGVSAVDQRHGRVAKSGRDKR